MLRPAASGWSGHVRLERRTMTGSMYFIVPNRSSGGTLSAALVGQRGGEYYAAPLGALRPDSRGQMTLALNFDPRLIDGRPLEAYPLIAVAETGPDGCRVVLTGNVDGAHPMDDASVQQAVCRRLAPEAPAADLPDPDDPPAQGEAPSPAAPAMAEAPPAIIAVEAAETAEVTGPVEAVAPTAPTTATETAAATSAPAERVMAPLEPAIIPEAAVPIEPLDATEAAMTAGPDVPAASPTAPDAAEEAGETPGPQAEPAAGLPSTTRIYTRMRRSGTRQATPALPTEGVPGSASDAATEALPAGTVPCAMPLEDGYAYIRAPLPTAWGAGYALVGIRREGGRSASVRVALPGSWSPQPPEGLSGSVWIGAGDGSGAGYWVTTLRCAALDRED